jgi:hypothetical protein
MPRRGGGRWRRFQKLRTTISIRVIRVVTHDRHSLELFELHFDHYHWGTTLKAIQRCRKPVSHAPCTDGVSYKAHISPLTDKQSQNKSKSKRIDVPQPKKKTQKELGVPKLKGLQRAVDAKAAKAARVSLDAGRLAHDSAAETRGLQGAARNEQTMRHLLATSTSTKPLIDDLPEIDGPTDPFSTLASTEHLSALRDSSTRAFTRELKKVIDRSDVIVQVLDARDPEGTRSRWVEEEVRKKESEGKRLMGVVNKIGEFRGTD